MRILFSKIVLAIFIAVLLASANAQQPAEVQTTTVVKKNAEQQKPAQIKERRGSITGHISTDGGQPLANIGVNIYQQGGATGGNTRNVSTDEERKFQADDLPAGAYSVSVYVPGYVAAGDSKESKYYRLGDDGTLNMVKGGVITGWVRNAAGEPVIGVTVRALRVRDAEGKPGRAVQMGRERQTDDRGVYRLYGLIGGTYVVVAGGRGLIVNSPYPNKYGDDVPTYFPSSTRDTAAQVPVQTGQEVANIDITYRGDKGHAVSGTVSGALPASGNYGISLSLTNAVSGVVESFTSINSYANSRGFAFYGVPDGDYLVTASAAVYMEPGAGGSATPRRLSVRGADVTGLDIAIVPFAAISGSVTLERLAPAAAKKCQANRDSTLEETLISLRPDLKDEAQEQQWFNASSLRSPDDKGAVNFFGLKAGRYRVTADLPSDNWYLKAITLQSAATGKQPNTGNVQLSEAASQGIALKAGDKLTGLKIVLAEGAANLSGRVTVEKEGESLPAKLLVHLIPFDKEGAADVLRFAQAEVKGDGTFSLANLAPGKYRLLARVADDGGEMVSRPLAWDTEGRAALRKEAEAANVTIELQMCQRLSDYSLRYIAPPVAKPAVKNEF